MTGDYSLLLLPTIRDRLLDEGESRRSHGKLPQAPWHDLAIIPFYGSPAATLPTASRFASLSACSAGSERLVARRCPDLHLLRVDARLNS